MSDARSFWYLRHLSNRCYHWCDVLHNRQFFCLVRESFEGVSSIDLKLIVRNPRCYLIFVVSRSLQREITHKNLVVGRIRGGLPFTSGTVVFVLFLGIVCTCIGFRAQACNSKLYFRTDRLRWRWLGNVIRLIRACCWDWRARWLSTQRKALCWNVFSPMYLCIVNVCAGLNEYIPIPLGFGNILSLTGEEEFVETLGMSP